MGSLFVYISRAVETLPLSVMSSAAADTDTHIDAQRTADIRIAVNFFILKSPFKKIEITYKYAGFSIHPIDRFVKFFAVIFLKNRRIS